MKAVKRILRFTAFIFVVSMVRLNLFTKALIAARNRVEPPLNALAKIV
jgi:hypothetical protein